jgi:hypothetical protein
MKTKDRLLKNEKIKKLKKRKKIVEYRRNEKRNKKINAENVHKMTCMECICHK